MMRSILVLSFIALFAVVATANESQSRLVELPDGSRRWVSEPELLQLIYQHKKANKFGAAFVDVTDHRNSVHTAAKVTRAFPRAPSQQDKVNPLISLMSVSEITRFLDGFSNGFWNRYYTSDSGFDSAVWLRDYMQQIATNAGRNDTSCELYTHTWKQPSVVCTVEGIGAFSEEIIIISAHSDSINPLNPVNGKAPGADDDGSGVADFVEVFRAIIQGGYRPGRTLQFIGYAAEEVGLRGSQAIATAYSTTGVPVYAVYHNEMSGWPGTSRSITILEDYVDSGLTSFLKTLVPVYTSLPLKTDRCYYCCSDHCSWYNAGYASVCTAEAGPSGDLNPNYHRPTDTLDFLDMSYSLEFAKLALGMTVELAEFRG